MFLNVGCSKFKICTYILLQETIVNEIGEEALLLGLLMGSDGDENITESNWVSFHHKMIQVRMFLTILG